MEILDVYLMTPEPSQGQRIGTRVWVTAAVEEAITDFLKRKEKHKGQFLKKLMRYSQDGFDLWTGENRPIRPEWGGVYRIGDSSLFRVVGFFDQIGLRRDFIACDAFLKHGQVLRKTERARIDRVAQILKTRGWRRIDEGA